MENIKKNPLSLQLNAEDFLPASNEEKQSLVVMRESVNNWIMSGNEADGYVDFAGALCNPERPMSLLDVYNSKDNLHPSLEGGKALADSVPAEYLK